MVFKTFLNLWLCSTLILGLLPAAPTMRDEIQQNKELASAFCGLTLDVDSSGSPLAHAVRLESKPVFTLLTRLFDKKELEKLNSLKSFLRRSENQLASNPPFSFLSTPPPR